MILRAEEAIRLSETGGGEVTLYIGSSQAMQAWERELMEASAALLCARGSEYLEVGLGLGISALAIAGNPRTRRHVVLEKYPEVIRLFRDRHPVVPETLEIRGADFFEAVGDLAAESLDGILFDPALPMSVWADQELWDRVMPAVVRALRPGGRFIPFFSTSPALRWQYLPFFRRVIVERHAYRAYPGTLYTRLGYGNAYIQCFIKED